MSVFSPQSRAELKIAVEDLLRFSSDGSMKLNGPISEWDVTQVTDMTRMFHMIGFNYDLSKWDVSRVSNMAAMFAYARAFNQDLSKWDVSHVTNMVMMFNNAESFNQDIAPPRGGGW